MAIDVARMITKYVNSIRLGGETADGETAANDTALLQPLTGYINVLVGPVAYAIRVDHTEILWRLVDKACKKIGVNIRVEVQVKYGAQDPGPYDVLVTMQVESQNNPNQINHWGLTSTGKVRVEFHDDAGADEELKLSFTGDRIPKEQKQLAAQRKVLPYFFIGFRPASGRGLRTTLPPGRKRTRLETKAANTSYDAFYRLVASSTGDGFEIVVAAPKVCS